MNLEIFPKGIEGDYIELENNQLIFDVKGVLHPKDKKICFLRFYPDPKGDRIRNNVKYKKIYDLKERFDFLKKNYPQYIFFSEQLDIEIQGVRNSEIKKIYHPKDFLISLEDKKKLTKTEELSLELCNLFIEQGGVPKESIGISGSLMVGLNKDESDIDIIIYGTSISHDFQESLNKILLNPNNYCRQYNLEEYKSHYKWRVGGSNIPFEKFLFSERRKKHQGIFKDREFFIRYIKSPNDWGGTFYDFKYKNYGRITLMAEIVDATDSIFTPCSYQINPLKIIDIKNIGQQEIRKDEIIEAASFRGRFCEQAIEGEKILIEGKLEKVYYKTNREYFRILLQDQINDKMIVIN
ncbi:MAG: hypothetical protein ACTSQP_09790 [Promethearchaeota archaeon]